jgi:hypothetical protein
MDSKSSNSKRKSSAYETVAPTDDDREELLSSTEVEDSLVGDNADAEKQWHEQRWARRDDSSSCRRSNRRWIISTVLQVIIIFLLAVILFQDKIMPDSAMMEETPQVGGAFNGKGPTCEFYRVSAITAWTRET